MIWLEIIFISGISFIATITIMIDLMIDTLETLVSGYHQLMKRLIRSILNCMVIMLISIFETALSKLVITNALYLTIINNYTVIISSIISMVLIVKTHEYISCTINKIIQIKDEVE